MPFRGTHNSTAERALRAVALGRKKYLLAGSYAGGERTANIYSLIGFAKLNGINNRSDGATISVGRWVTVKLRQMRPEILVNYRRAATPVASKDQPTRPRGLSKLAAKGRGVQRFNYRGTCDHHLCLGPPSCPMVTE